MNEYRASDIINDLYFSQRSPRLTQENEILEEYLKPENGIGKPFEFPDRIGNINGNHIYKILSAKDIDFNNVLIPNSVVDEMNWGSFDEKRRWPSGSQIHINDVYELMNIVDYLLCATEDLWSEINKLKYGSNTIVAVWFINNITQQINQIYAASSDQFIKNSPNFAITLDPKKYFTTFPEYLKNFGIATQFNTDNHDLYPIIRKISANTNRNGIKAYIERESKNDPDKVQSENVSGQIVNIYGYNIGYDIHFYPMFNIENLLSSNKDKEKFDILVDVNATPLPKLKYDLYFRVRNSITGLSEFKQVFLDPLYYNFGQVGHPYILYFLDDNGKRNIIYIHTTQNDNNLNWPTVRSISEQLANYNLEYINKFYGNHLDDFGEQEMAWYIKNNDDNQQYPVLYHISDSGNVNLYVETPNTPDYSLSSNDITINYYKSNNNIDSEVKYEDTSSHFINATKSNDIDQKNSLLYSPSRYFLPDNSNINIGITANYLDTDANIKYDDEYIDVLIPQKSDGEYKYFFDENTENDEAKKYYYYSNLNNNGKRTFIQFNSASDFNGFFDTNNVNHGILVHNVDGTLSAHVYKKINDSYKLKYELTTNSLLNQIEDYPIVKEHADNIRNNISFTKGSNKYDLNFNYRLPDEIEQLKFDIDFTIDETSKVSKEYLKLPISLNKVHEPHIQFVSRDIMNKEILEYSNKYAYIYGDYQSSAQPGDIWGLYRLANKTIDSIITNNYITWNGTIEEGTGTRKRDASTVQQNIGDQYDEFPSFKDVFTYLITNNYNNFEILNYQYNPARSIRTDLLYNINSSNTTIDSLTLSQIYERATTYDNSNGNMNTDANTLSIQYDMNKQYINLIGGKEMFVKMMNNSSNLSYAFIKTKTYKEQNSETKFIKFEEIFSINGFGFNYRLHGGDSYLYINRNGSDMAGHTQPIDLPFDRQYDLKSNICKNDLNNIIKFMEVTLEDGNNQFKKVTNNGKNISNDNIIENKIVNISTKNYEIFTQNDYHRIKTHKLFNYNYNNQTNIKNEWSTTYYVPITYIKVNDTTFFPDQGILPSNMRNYDLTEQTDLTRYGNYIQFWDSTSNEEQKYKPILLSIKLKENLDNNTPFFKESNTAKLKFNILRGLSNSTDVYAINGSPNLIKLIIGQRYYISDFFEINPLSNNQIACIGSYPKYNEETELFDINEIYEAHSPNILIPIFENEYNIEKISTINKIPISNIELLKGNVTIVNDLKIGTNIFNNTLYIFNISKLQGDADGIVNILNNLNNIHRNNGTTSFALYNEPFTLNFGMNVIFGNKYFTNTSVSSGPNVNIQFYSRTIPVKDTTNSSRYDILHYSETQNGQTSAISINTISNSDGFTYRKLDQSTLQLKHYDGFLKINNQSSETKEFLVIPDYTNTQEMNSIYIYQEIGGQPSMKSLSEIFENGIDNDNYESFINIIITTFESGRIFKKITT